MKTIANEPNEVLIFYRSLSIFKYVYLYKFMFWMISHGFIVFKIVSS